MRTEKTLGQRVAQSQKELGKRRLKVDRQDEDITQEAALERDGYLIAGFRWFLLAHGSEEDLGFKCPNADLTWVVRELIKDGLVHRPSGECPICRCEPLLVDGPMDVLPEGLPEIMFGRPAIWVVGP